jgi:hypothetical protein
LTSSERYNYNELEGTAEATQSIERLGTWTKQRKEKEQMDNEVKPTWKLAWGLWWRMFLITLGISVIIGVILALVGVSLIPWELMPWCMP